jgi:MFS family permease
MEAMSTMPAKVFPLPQRRRGLSWLLGLGAFGLALSLTTTSAYLPPLLGRFTNSRALIAVILGSEGIFALTLPLVVGPWSDTFQTPMGRRRPFMLVALWPLGFCLALIAFMPSLWLMALILLAFFFAYYVYEPPYRGLYPDLLPQSEYGRSQGVQHLLRGLAIGTGLIGGGLLFDVWHPAPFLITSVGVVAACGATIYFVHEPPAATNRVFEGVRAYLGHSWRILQAEPEVRRFLVCNSAWEGTFAGARFFVVLYITRGLGESVAISTAVLATVASGYVIAAAWAGRVGDRLGLARVIYYCSFLYGGGLLLGGLVQRWHDWYLALMFPVTIAGGAVMTLAWGLLFKVTPAEHRGTVVGLATTTKGFGLIIGPIAAGVAMDTFGRYFPSTDGYQLLWPILAMPILAVIPLVSHMSQVEASSGMVTRRAG